MRQTLLGLANMLVNIAQLYLRERLCEARDKLLAQAKSLIRGSGCPACVGLIAEVGLPGKSLAFGLIEEASVPT